MSEEPKLGVGSTVWRFDVNRREYEVVDGRKIIYRSHWRPLKITGETARSWIVPQFEGDRSPRKAPKKGPHRGWAFSQREVDMDVFLHNSWDSALRELREALSSDHARYIAACLALGIDVPEGLR